MKLQIDGTHLRLRLSEAQLATLFDSGHIVAALPCPNGSLARRALQLDDTIEVPACKGDLLDLRIRLPSAAFLAFAAARPRRDGYRFTSNDLDIDIEVDVRDSRRQQAAGQTNFT